jgi:hypothetical protein
MTQREQNMMPTFKCVKGNREDVKDEMKTNENESNGRYDDERYNDADEETSN